MFNPSDPATGRGLLLFALFLLGLGLFLGVARSQWVEAALWVSLAIFLGCYGAIMRDLLPHLHRVLLVIGFAAGGIAFVLALLAVVRG
jgi:hypothetical protein